MRILLVEDEPDLATELQTALKREGFVADHVGSIDMALEAGRDGVHDLALLDRSLPDGDGLSLIAPLRECRPGMPVIVLSARGELGDRVAGLDRGADDYLVKPFALEEMFARIRAVRRRPLDLGPENIQIGALVFDPVHDEAVVGNSRLNLTRRELYVLKAMIGRRGRTLLRESLERAVYGFDDEISSNSLDSHVSRLRQKLAEADAHVQIHTIRGVGYLLRSSV